MSDRQAAGADGAAYLKSLADAVNAAESAFMTAAISAQPGDEEHLQLLLGALDNTKAAFNRASKESLVRNNAFVKREQKALDEVTEEVTSQLDSLKEIDQWLDLVSRLAQLAGSVATAFA